jgi:hypothetical protein
VYLLKDDNDESIYPTKCFQLFNNAKGGKSVNLNNKIGSSNDLYIRLYDVWHLNICNDL